MDIDLIPRDDPPSYELLKRRPTTAVFQLESRGMKELIEKLLPDCFDDIIALVALFRPGPLQSGMVDDFINVKHGAKAEYAHPAWKPILKPTYGVIVYQEQVMQIAKVLAGYTPGWRGFAAAGDGEKKARRNGQATGNLRQGRDKNRSGRIHRHLYFRPDGEICRNMVSTNRTRRLMPWSPIKPPG